MVSINTFNEIFENLISHLKFLNALENIATFLSPMRSLHFNHEFVHHHPVSANIPPPPCRIFIICDDCWHPSSLPAHGPRHRIHKAGELLSIIT